MSHFVHHMHALWSNVTKGGWNRFSRPTNAKCFMCVDARQLHVMDDAPNTQIAAFLSILVTTSIKWCFGGSTLVAAPKIWSHLLQLGFPPPDR